MTRRVRPKDEGAMLVIALLIVTVVAVVSAALLSLAGGKFASTVVLRQVAATGYAGDAAAKIAITDMVQGQNSNVPGATYPTNTPHGWVYDNNTDGSGCFGKDSSGNPYTTLTLPSMYNDAQSKTTQTATVVCSPVAGTGLFAGDSQRVVTPDASDAFARALTTVGTGTVNGAVDGMTLKPLGSGASMPIRGSIESKTFIAVSNGQLQTNGTIVALSGCSTSGGGSFSPACATSGFVTPNAPPAVLSSIPAWRNPATQGCEFQPGFYNNGTALSAAVNACGTAHFNSGVYYFDFADGKPLDLATRVIGGEMVAGHSIPGACVSPIDHPATPGVQFVFGASSGIKVEDTSRVEFCGPANNGNAPLTLYQQQSGTTPSAATISPTVPSGAVNGPLGAGVQPFVVKPTGSPDTLAQAVSATGGSTATWTASKAKDIGELDLTDFPGANAIPAGSTITSVQFAVNYSASFAPNATFTAGVSGQGPAQTIGAPNLLTKWSPDVDLTTQVKAAIGSGGFGSTTPKIQLLVGGSTAKNDTVSVDAVRLTVTYVPPALRAATIGPFIYEQGGNFAGQFVVEGATYAPQGYLNLVPGSNSNALISFRWGVLAWGVNFQSQPPQTFGYPLVSIPDVGYGLGSAVTAVDLKVFLCEGAGPCSTSGTPALTARVQFTDLTSNGIVDPVPGQRKVAVLSWAAQR